MTETQFIQKLDAFITENERAYIEDLRTIIAINSVEGPSTENAPFGEGPHKALNATLKIATRMGFSTYNCDGRLGWAQLEGRESAHLATITHLDVVPEGSGWAANPFVLQEKEGWLIGRGVCDDKGPSMLCLYAAKFLKELGAPLRYGLRVLFGTNEEAGMADIDYYLERNEQPLFCFSPDAYFPVCNGEKGGYGGVFVSSTLAGNLCEFSGGVANNVIPDRAFCLVKNTGTLPVATSNITVTEENNLIKLSAKGIGGHAAHPAGTLNAIALLTDYLLENQLCTKEENTFLALLQKLHSNTGGANLGIACKDDIFGELSCIGGTISFANGQLRQSMDIRFPTTSTGTKLQKVLMANAAMHCASFEAEKAREPFYISPEAPAIQTLLCAYNDVSGEKGKPFTMGGGTYARHFKNAVSFGPETKGASVPDFAGPIHGANEGVSLESLMQALKIYALAIWRLQNIDFE